MATPKSSLARIDGDVRLAEHQPLAASDVTRAFFARRAATTITAYRADLLKLARWFNAGIGPSDLNSFAKFIFSSSPGHLNAKLIEWVDESTKQGLAPLTVNRRLSALRSLVKLGRTLGVVNWTLDVQGVRGARGVRDMRGPVPTDITKLFAAARDPFEVALLHLLYTRGLRMMEVRELRVKHLLLDRGEILIRGKGKSGLAPLTVSTHTVEVLQRLSGPHRPPDSFVFALRRPTNMPSHNALSNILHAIAKRAGVKHVRPHGLRHSAITAVLDATNGDIRKTQKFSRHVNPAVLLNHYDDARQDFGGELTQMLDDKGRK